MAFKFENRREGLKLAIGQDWRFAFRGRQDMLLRRRAADEMDRAETDADPDARESDRMGITAADGTAAARTARGKWHLTVPSSQSSRPE